MFRKFDHIGIYIFIAATYTPVCIFSLPRNVGILILSVIWSCAFNRNII
ncbi:hemolysin III family protein [Brachyspira hyodysenteriae]|nr:hemolysin III family protein [Brachyspira hyodysenteriae]